MKHREKETFLNWRRSIAKREEEVLLKTNTPWGVTPFEKNIEIWRQLWRVMERSSCIVQVVDARNPLFYLSKDLKAYATQELGKPMLLLINKSDYLTAAQRQAWHDYLSESDHCWEHVFFSAHDEQERLDRRMTAYEDGLLNQFIAMERILSSLDSSGGFLDNLIDTLPFTARSDR